MCLFDDRHSDAYYDSWEIEPEESRNRIIRALLNQYVEFAKKKIPFYRDRVALFEPDSPHPLSRVPVLTSAQLRELLPPKSNELMAEETGNFSVFQSGGTTGMPKTTLFSHDELEMLNLPNARGFFALGLRKEDRVANLFAVGGLYMTFLHINRMLQQYGCMNFPFSNQTSYDFVHSVIRLFNVNVITGIASVVLDCIRKMHDLGLKGISIEKIFYGGEHIYEADRREMKEMCGAGLIAAPGYGTVDTWYIGYQCIKCGPGEFHAHDDQCYIEIVEAESGRHCGSGEAGMLYATPFTRRLTPIIRYQVGDLALWTGERCKCGRTTPVFRLLGRGDDVLRIGYDSIEYGFIQDAAAQVKGLSGTLQIEKERRGGRDRLIIRVESQSPSSEHPGMKRTLDDIILDRRPTLRGFIEKGTVWPIEIDIFPPGSISRSDRTGKLKRVIDAL